MLNTAPDQQVEVTENLKVYPFFMDNEVVRGGVLIEKRDLESLLLTPLGGASLDGTLFEITNKSKNAVYVDGALYQPDEVCLTIEVKDGVAQSDVRALPYGTYSMVESKPGQGYLWTDKKVRDFTVRADGEVTEFREGDAAYNQVKRGDLRFVKVGEDNMHRFANVAFKLTSQTTGESHMRRALSALQEQVSRLKQQTKSQYETFVLGEIGKEAYLAVKAMARQKEEILSEQIAKLELSIEQTQLTDSNKDGLAVKLQPYLDVEQFTEDILDGLLEQVLVFSGGRLEIRWKFQDELERLRKMALG